MCNSTLHENLPCQASEEMYIKEALKLLIKRSVEDIPTENLSPNSPSTENYSPTEDDLSEYSFYRG